MFAFFVYGKGNPFAVLATLGFSKLAMRTAAAVCDSRHTRYIPVSMMDAAEHYAYVTRDCGFCCGCIKVLWQDHAFEHYHDACYARELADEALFDEIRNDLAAETLVEYGISGLAQAEWSSAADNALREWLDSKDISDDVRALTLVMYRAR